MFEGWIPAGYTAQDPLSYTEPFFEAKNIVLVGTTFVFFKQ